MHTQSRRAERGKCSKRWSRLGSAEIFLMNRALMCYYKGCNSKVQALWSHFLCWTNVHCYVRYIADPPDQTVQQ